MFWVDGESCGGRLAKEKAVEEELGSGVVLVVILG